VSKSGPIVNLPNLLSFARLGLLPVFLLLLTAESSAARLWAFVLGFFGLISDVLDGFLARRLNQVTEFGKILDPLSDKIIVAGLTIFAVLEKNFPLWLGALILGRDILIVLMAVLWKNKLAFIPTSNLIGKLAALVVAVTLLAYVFDFHSAARILTPAALGMILFSSAVYGRRFLRQLGRTAALRTGGSNA
jgi:CDP-diacylglycerol--glycerol-3-phosphate 3-phosphatidyltransferase